MKRILIPIFLVVTLLAHAQQKTAQTFTIAKSPEEAGFSSERLKRLDALMQSFVADGIAPNVLTFVAHNGKVVAYNAYGYSNLEKKNH